MAVIFVQFNEFIPSKTVVEVGNFVYVVSFLDTTERKMKNPCKVGV